jgi:hypothetical protein
MEPSYSVLSAAAGGMDAALQAGQIPASKQLAVIQIGRAAISFQGKERSIVHPKKAVLTTHVRTSASAVPERRPTVPATPPIKAASASITQRI